MPVLEYAGGIQFVFCWYTSVLGATRSLNNAFPELLRVGPSGVYMYYANYVQSMNNAFPLLTRIDGFFRIENCFTIVQGSAQVTIANSFTSLSTVASYMYVECTRARARVCVCVCVCVCPRVRPY
jgi:hypothetical protein